MGQISSEGEKAKGLASSPTKPWGRVGERGDQAMKRKQTVGFVCQDDFNFKFWKGHYSLHRPLFLQTVFKLRRGRVDAVNAVVPSSAKKQGGRSQQPSSLSDRGLQ